VTGVWQRPDSIGGVQGKGDGSLHRQPLRTTGKTALCSLCLFGLATTATPLEAMRKIAGLCPN